MSFPMSLTVDAKQFSTVEKKISPGAMRNFQDEVRAETWEAGQELLSQIRIQAGTPPGPQVITGAYVASWQMMVAPGASEAAPSVLIYSNHPAARRLEFGFVGADALGRVYNQAPFPHVSIALVMMEPRFQDRMSQVVANWIKE